MTDAMAYRGPDGIEHYIEGSVALGHCQMHTTAESLEERQPLASEEGGRIVAMDGYLANYDDLRAELLQRGARLRDRSDAELVLRAYEAWGEDCPQHIDGEYAFIVWDAARRSIFCARDHQGLRPLLYHWDGTTFIAASDVAAILALLPENPALNHGFLAEFLTGNFYSPEETIWSGIERLGAAHSMTVGPAGLVSRRYWTLPLEVTLTYPRDEDYFAHYRALLEECVRRAARSHRPLACDVSGGLDSTALFCVARDLARQGRFSAPEVRGYTLAGPPGTKADEIEFVREAARSIGVSVHEHPLFMPSLGWFTEQAHQARDLPSMPNAAMSVLQQQAQVADGCRASMNGLGGDQWLSGSGFYYMEALKSGDLARLAQALRTDSRDFGWKRTVQMLAYFGVAASLPPPVRGAIRRLRSTLPGRGAPKANDVCPLSPALTAELARRRDRYMARSPESPSRRLKQVRLSDPYLASVFDSNNRQAARTGLDQRHPMLSRKFAEFSTTTPEHIRRRGREDKFVHRRALADILPLNIRQRTTKAEFSVVYFDLDEEIGQMISQSLDPRFNSIAEASGAEITFEIYCSATIDTKNTHAVWGIYVVNMLLGLA